MASDPRRFSGATAVFLVVSATLTGCSEEPEGPGPGPEPDGDVPFSLVLPDDLSVSPDGSEVLADCWDGICRWNAADGSLAAVDDGGHVAISPDWSLLATVGDEAQVVLSDRESGDVVHELTGLDDAEVADGSPVLDVAFSADGSHVAATGIGGAVTVWTVDDGAEVSSLTLDDDAERVALSPDGAQVGVSGGGPVEVYDVAAGDRLATVADDSPDGSGLAWSPDGRWLAAPAADGTPTVWETGSYTEVDRLAGARLDEAAFSPDSRQVALTGGVTTVRLWTPEGRVRDLVGHGEEPGAVAFAPSGRTLYSVSGADGIVAWDVRTGEMTDRFELPEK